MEQSLISVFCKRSPGSAAAVLALAFCQLTSAAAQELAVRCPLEPPTPSWGIPTPLLTSVSLLFIGLFTGRAVTGKKKREPGSLLF